jgi:hypothetical protein
VGSDRCYILAGEVATLQEKDNLSCTAAVVQGAKIYEETLRPIGTSNHGDSERFESLIFPRLSWGIWILHAFAKVAASFRLDQGMDRESKTSKWQILDYPALKRDRLRYEGHDDLLHTVIDWFGDLCLFIEFLFLSIICPSALV